MGAVVDRVAAALDSDLLWAAGGSRCIRLAADTLRVVDGNGDVRYESRLSGVDLDELR